MAHQATVLRVMVGSPSDVQEERQAAVDVINSWNATHGAASRVYLHPVLWETHSTPEMGERPQAILNKQLVQQCDILVGVFWTRLGTETGEARSGTVEEVAEFRAEGKPVLLYFSNKPVSPDEVDTDQYTQLLEYRRECESEGLLAEFDSLASFREQLARHLTNTVRQLPAAGASSRILIPENQRKSVIFGAQLVEAAVARAYGPNGGRVSVSLGGPPVPRRQGAAIALGVRSHDPLEREGIRHIAELATDVNASVGDATKLSILVASNLMRGGEAFLAEGHNRGQLLAGIDVGLEAILECIAVRARPHSGDTRFQIAQTAANDDAIAALVVEAADAVGEGGVVSVEQELGEGSEVKTIEGFQIDRGFISDAFVNEVARERCVLDDCFILLHDRKINTMFELLPILEAVASQKRPLLIAAEDVEGEALATLIVNMGQGALSCAAVRSPATGAQRRALLEDIAIVTGGAVISAEKGQTLRETRLSDLGEADRVIVTRSSTIITGGRGDPSRIEARAEEIRGQLAGSGLEREQLNARLANLSGGVARIIVRGLIESDAFDHRYRASSALSSLLSSGVGGWIPSGPSTLVQCSAQLSSLKLEQEHQPGVEVLQAALSQPLAVLAEAVSLSASDTIEAVAAMASDSGLDGASGDLCNLVELGRIDSAEAVAEALRQAVARAKDALLTEEWYTA